MCISPLRGRLIARSIQGGRHPLVERCVPQYVPNDTVLVRIDSASAPLLPLKRDKVGGRGVKEEEEAVPLDNPSGLSPNQSILILTGANGSGKSVYLKVRSIDQLAVQC
jgi:DNA mismatch repair protein MSH5